MRKILFIVGYKKYNSKKKIQNKKKNDKINKNTK
jgi:hypothetical protein